MNISNTHNADYLIKTNLVLDAKPPVRLENDIISIKYDTNEYGYRTNKFIKKDKNVIMILGCSQTYGIGVPDSYRWGNILSEKINMKEITLGIPGDSAMSQVRKAFAYFKEFGHPQKIVALFPLSRIQAPLVFEKNNPIPEEKGYDKFTYENNNEIHTYYLNDKRFQKYSKAPHNLENVLSKEVAFFFSFSYISMLDQYCKSNNIEFFWSFWENVGFVDNNIEKIKNEYSSFYDSRHIKINEYEDTCHTEYSNDILFQFAADRKESDWNAHFGLHTHLHFAEMFYEIMVSKK